MTKNTNIKNLIELNIAVLLISTSGPLGRYIDMPVTITIGIRALIAGILLFLFCKWKGFNLRIEKKDRGILALSGLLMGLHWLTYFYALRLSNVAIGMLSMFTFPVITSFLEPLILKTRFQKIQILLGALVLLGVYFLVPEFDFENDYFKAIGMGVLSALLYSLRNIITKNKVSNYNGSIVMMYQLAVIAICLLPFYAVFDIQIIAGQLAPLIALALVTTAIGHTLFLYTFNNFSVASASIMSSSQPIYGILVGIFFLNEYPDMSSIIGGSLILTSVLLESLRAYKKGAKKV
ncbi:DMT family transporter [Labilibacter marinus]|uniref:DMT family transporter n=1 Tax=Labilibacter marinus TaxID=1477105 RepID=UPI000833484C|nr:EamA family transporter [Labilibacter marinus]